MLILVALISNFELIFYFFKFFFQIKHRNTALNEHLILKRLEIVKIEQNWGFVYEMIVSNEFNVIYAI